MLEADWFHVDSYEVLLEVNPVVPKRVEEVCHGVKKRSVRYDNSAHMRRTVRFAEDNSCQGLFTLRYGTRGDGFITVPEIFPPANEASPADLGRYHDHGKEVSFRFTPRAGSTYGMNFRVLGAFNPGDRNVHFHLHPKTRYESIVVTLDLLEYVNQGYPLTEGPHLYYHGDDPQDHDLCRLRGFGQRLKPSHTGRGRWAWQICGVSQGVIDVVWDVEGPERRARDDDPEETRRTQLVKDNLTACQVFELVMKVMKAVGPVSFRQVEENATGLMPRSGPGSDLPLSQSQISKLMPRVESLLADPVFFGQKVSLFRYQHGRDSQATEKAEAALDLLRPYLSKLANDPLRGK